jgi:hypothetical protein
LLISFVAEFVIETNTFSGDGTKVREMSSMKDISAVEGKSLFINICSSDLIEPPKDKDGKPIKNSRTMADGLEIPLVIGPVRPLSEKANAVDVIFNPVVSKTCKEERYFRGQVLELAQDWIIQERDIKFKKNSYVDIDDVSYKGGLGDNGCIPVLFNVDEDADNKKPENKASSGFNTNNNPLSSTKSLLKEVLGENDSEPVVTELPSFATVQSPQLAATEKNKSKKPIIEDLSKQEDSKPSLKMDQEPPDSEKVTKPLSKTEKKKFDEILDMFEDPYSMARSHEVSEY